MTSNITTLVEELIHPILEGKDLELVDVEYIKEGNDWFLRVYLDKEGGIGIEECSLVSGELSEELDRVDIIEENYFLEVSSPGVERPLKTKKDFMENINENIYVTLYVNIDGAKEYEGILKDFTNDVVTIAYKIKTRTKEVEIPYDKVAKARLAVVL